MARWDSVTSACLLLCVASGVAAWTGCGLDAERRSAVEARRTFREASEGPSVASRSRAVAEADEPWTAGIAGHSAGSHAMIVYTVRWGRAEDLAQALEPILKSRYGEEARVVPHVPSNKLFLYIPSQRPEDRRRAQPPAAAAR